MTMEEKLRTMEALWDDLVARIKELPVPQWHKDVLDEREHLVEKREAQFVDWETAKNRINEHCALKQ